MKKMFRVVSLMIALTFAFSIFSFAYSPIIGDNYPQVYDLYWNNKTAKWSVDGRANKYEIRLYRDGRRVSTKTQTGRSRNFTSEMSRGDHEYYFEVRPYNSVTGWGNWEQSAQRLLHTDSRKVSSPPTRGRRCLRKPMPKLPPPCSRKDRYHTITRRWGRK